MWRAFGWLSLQAGPSKALASEPGQRAARAQPARPVRRHRSPPRDRNARGMATAGASAAAQPGRPPANFGKCAYRGGRPAAAGRADAGHVPDFEGPAGVTAGGDGLRCPAVPTTLPASGSAVTVARALAASARRLHRRAPRTIANGRFELVRLLGEGGKKRVYLARDTHLDREVALALIKTDGLDATGRARVLREAQAMGRLGADPNIVAVFDLGEEDGQPYFVSELMAGGDLEGLLDRTPEAPAADPRASSTSRSGITQGPRLRPREGPRPPRPEARQRLADGRRARPRSATSASPSRMERSRLTQEGMIVGTVAYLPPEQALGGEVTPRADLYSLGALLYECLTGRPPFLGDDPVAIISQHINTPPVAPSWHRADCPQGPRGARPAAARQGPDGPTRIGGRRPRRPRRDRAPTRRPLPTRTEPDERSLDALASGVFVGRRRELETLRAALEETLSGHGRMVTLVGEPGIGKTRTATELTTYARLRQAQVLWGRCYESAGAPPYWPFVQALRGYVREHEPEQLRRELGSTARPWPRSCPRSRRSCRACRPAGGRARPGALPALRFGHRLPARRVGRPADPARPRRSPLGRRGHPRPPRVPRPRARGRASPRPRHVPRRRAHEGPSPRRHPRRADAGAPLRAGPAAAASTPRTSAASSPARPASRRPTPWSRPSTATPRATRSS